MRTNMIFILFTAVATIISCTKSPVTSDIKSQANRVGYLRGYRAMNDLLMTKILNRDGSYVDMGWMLDGSRDQSQLTGFRSLLGGFSSTTAHAAFQNGSPNAVNLLLWDMIVTQLTKNLATVCLSPAPEEGVPDYVYFKSLSESGNQAELKPVFSSKLRQVCAWPDDQEARFEAMRSLWFSVAGFEAPAEEVEAWTIYFAGPDSPLLSAAPEVRTAALLKGMLLNPYIFLEN